VYHRSCTTRGRCEPRACLGPQAAATAWRPVSAGPRGAACAGGLGAAPPMGSSAWQPGRGGMATQRRGGISRCADMKPTAAQTGVPCGCKKPGRPLASVRGLARRREAGAPWRRCLGTPPLLPLRRRRGDRSADRRHACPRPLMRLARQRPAVRQSSRHRRGQGTMLPPVRCSGSSAASSVPCQSACRRVDRWRRP